MKKISCFTIAAILLSSQYSLSIELHQDQQDETAKVATKHLSGMKNNQRYRFKEEIVVTDDLGENSIFLSVLSDDKESIREYVENHKFTLSTGEQKIAAAETEESDSINFIDTTQEPKVVVDLKRADLKTNMAEFSLNVNSTSGFIFGYPVGYTTKNNFIGAVHSGWGYEFVAKLKYLRYWYSLSWTEVVDSNGANAWFIYPSGQYYISLGSSYNLYKRGIVIYPHLYQTQQNYRITYSKNDFRGHNCTIGSYDGANCYAGTPPSGTTAFMYPSNTGAFYYTPVNGNQCPVSGSWFDGANCYFKDIPNTCTGFIYQNKWYVKPDLI